MLVTLSNHKHYYVTNIYYTFTQAHMDFLVDHLLKIVLKYGKIAPSTPLHLNDPGRTRFIYQRFSCEYVRGLKSCQHKIWHVGIRCIMVEKSKRLNYIASEIVNGIKSKIHNKTNDIICMWALRSQSKRPVYTHVKTFLWPFEFQTGPRAIKIRKGRYDGNSEKPGAWTDHNIRKQS